MRCFKGKQFKQDIILVAVGCYCPFSLSYRDVFEILKEPGTSVLTIDKAPALSKN
uniref:Uncharacterized protein n=1 Tax=Bacillus cereus HuA4-10 TaxID=1053206 RepID=J8D8V0_BACCE|nr:hypothetical protein IGC_04518 [Bacillus cereus HuA4-10]